jgi:cytochrome oxidase Cu insertion factor (SCO1/SenC/PrrC family)
LNRLPILAALLLALAINASAATTPAAVARLQSTSPKIGQQAPTFTLRDQNGKRINLADAAGAKVVLVFYRGYW